MQYRATTLAVALVIGGAAMAPAQDVEEFFAGQTVRLLIGYSAGGGYDSYARLMARHIGKHIPGNPDVVAENMPGAGSLTLTNYLANAAPRDGTAFGAVSRGVPVEPLFGDGTAQFDAQALTWVGSMTDEVSVCTAWADSGIESWEQVTQGGDEFIVGGTGATSDVEVFTRMLIQLFDANLTLISGYPGAAEMALAMEQGEIEGRCGWSWSSVLATQSEWLEGGRLNLLLQLATESAPGLEDVPLVTEYAESADQMQVLQLVLSRLQIARPFVAPPGLPEDRAQALQQAFWDAANDPELLAEAEQMGLEMNPMHGADVTALIAEMHLTPDDVIERTRAILAVQ